MYHIKCESCTAAVNNQVYWIEYKSPLQYSLQLYGVVNQTIQEGPSPVCEAADLGEG